MEFIKYQQKVLKSERAVGCEVDDNRVLISADGCMAVVMRKSECRIDISKLRSVIEPPLDDSQAQELKLTNDCKFIRQKDLVRRFEFESGKPMYVQEKFIKIFSGGVAYKGDPAKQVVFVYSHDKIIGLIMGILLKQEDKNE